MAQKRPPSAVANDPDRSPVELSKLSIPDLYKELQCSPEGLDSARPRNACKSSGPMRCKKRRRASSAYFAASFGGRSPG